MTSESIRYFLLWTLLAGSILLIIPVFLVLRRKKNLKLKLLIYLGIVIFLFRLFVELNEFPSGESGLLWYEKVFDSIIHTFQSFSYDDDYSYFLIQGRSIFDSWGIPGAGEAYSLLSSILNVCAPLAAGAYLIDLLTNLFPHLRIMLSPFQKKVVFSQLNPSSLLLFEDMIRNDKEQQKVSRSKRPLWKRIESDNTLYIFCDAHSYSEAEEQSLKQAKALGAVCIAGDLLSLNLYRSMELDYFLIDEKAENNLTNLSKLLSIQNKINRLWPEVDACSKKRSKSNCDAPRFRPAQFYLFVENQNQAEMADLICRQHSDVLSKVLILPIAKNRMIAMNLIQKYPLFLPEIIGTKKGSLEVVLFSGIKGIELLKNIYWAGQIPDTALTIRVITENPNTLKNQLQIECPELLESCKKESPILKIYNDPSDHSFAKPYAEIQFLDAAELHCSDALFEPGDPTRYGKSLNSEFNENIFRNADVFIVAYDEDLRNIEVSSWLSRVIAINRLKSPSKETMILPEIKSSELAEGIRKTESADGLPLILPFGLQKECFSCETVLNTNYIEEAVKSARHYNEHHDQKIEIGAYQYWSDLARSIHADYKMFGMGWIDSYSFDENNRISFRYPEKLVLTEEDNLKLAYAEHRRWNAYLRSIGYRQPDLQEFSAYSLQNHKNGIKKTGSNTLLKLHPCLVETDGKRTSLTARSLQLEGKMDYLDFVSVLSYLYNCEADLSEKPTLNGLMNFEYKSWDFMVADSALMDRLKHIHITDQTEGGIYDKKK